MSVLFLKQLRIHREQLQKKLGGGSAVVEQELAQTRQFLIATKDPKWKNQLMRRIRALEGSRKSQPDRSDVQKRLKLIDEMYEIIQAHPDYNRPRKKRMAKA